MSESNGQATATPATDQAPSATPPAPDAGAKPECEPQMKIGGFLIKGGGSSMSLNFAVKGTKVEIGEGVNVSIDEVTLEAESEQPNAGPLMVEFAQKLKQMIADKGWIPKSEPKGETPQPTAA